MSFKKTLPKIVKCPFCNARARKIKEVCNQLSIENYLVHYYSYYCRKCKTRFNTTESDTISLKKMNYELEIQRKSNSP